MLLRICLFLTIAAGLATAYLGFFPVKDIVTTTREARDDFHTKLTAETDLYNKTNTKLKNTAAELATTKSQLTTAQNDLAAANAKNDDLDKENTTLKGNLDKMTARANSDEQLLEKYRELPPPEQILVIMRDLTNDIVELAAVHQENNILVKSRNGLQKQLNDLIGDTQPPPAMPGVRGVVMAVDPKYDFVVLNIGDDQGAKERGELMVDRKGRLIGKVRITSVEKDRSVATILADWKRGDVREGDQVIY